MFSNDIPLPQLTKTELIMGNANISVPKPQFKDQISANERLSICDRHCPSKNHSVTRYRSEKENYNDPRNLDHLN